MYHTLSVHMWCVLNRFYELNTKDKYYKSQYLMPYNKFSETAFSLKIIYRNSLLLNKDNALNFRNGVLALVNSRFHLQLIKKVFAICRNSLFGHINEGLDICVGVIVLEVLIYKP